MNERTDPRPLPIEDVPEGDDEERKRFITDRVAAIRENLDALEQAMGVRIKHGQRHRDHQPD